MVAVNMRNWATIMRSPANISWFALTNRAVKANATAATNEPMATVLSTFLSCTIFDVA